MSRKRPGGRARAFQATSSVPVAPVNEGVLAKDFFRERVPQAENYRTHYGKSLDLQRIDWAIRSANNGLMREITDIGRETVSLDGHLSALLQKRLNRLAALDWDVQPSTDARANQSKAEFYAGYVRAQLESIPRFRDAVVDLDWGVYDGRAASELDWRFLDGDWALIGLNWIHPRRLSFGPNRDVRVIDSLRGETGGFLDVGFPLELVPYKFAVYTPRLFGDYQEREGLNPRVLYWSFFQRFGTRERMALLELFGRPWRIVKPLPNATVGLNDEGAKTAFEAVKNLGYVNTARLPPGWDLDIHQPFTGAGQVSSEAIDHASKVLSKLFLGSTGTTDAVSTGLGSSIGDAHLSEEDLVIWSDARRLAETIEDKITDAIIAVNFGPDELVHAPRFMFRTEAPISREQEVARIKGALELGMRVSLEEAQEKLGVQEVRDDQPYLQRITRPSSGAFGVVPTPMNETVYPMGAAPPPGELADDPSPTVNLPAGGDDGAPSMPPASPPAGALPALPAANDTGAALADVDEPDSVAALCEKMNELGLEACYHGRKNVCPWCGIEATRDVEMVNGEPQWRTTWKPIRQTPSLRSSSDDVRAELERELAEAPTAWARTRDWILASDHVCLAAQPSSVFGSPELLVERGVDETLAGTEKLADAIVKAVSGKTSARAIKAAIDGAAKRFDDRTIAEPVERELLQGLMLGALDAGFEAEEETPIDVESFAALHSATRVLADTDTRFAARPIQEAIKKFLEKDVVTRAEFDEMEKAAQRRAFTVARAANEEMVRTVKRELVRQLAIGADLRDFGKHAAERFESAGWTPANPSHVETVFRTNVLGAYSSGRARQMSQPDVLELRPYWQVLTANDPPRIREHHRAMHGVVLKATDPFWKEAYPPWGYNCRCRVRSLSATSREAHARVQEGKGAKFSRLPDRGFASGLGTLL